MADSWQTTLTAKLHPQQLTTSLIAGSITGIIGVIRAISYAALIFSGSLASDLNVGVGIAVFSSAIISIVVALTSSLPGMIATPLAAPTVVLTMMAAAIADRLGPSHDVMLWTVVAAIALGAVLTGLALWLLGQLRWGDALDVLPYPVVGGFMAGTGLLLVRGAVKVMTGSDLTWQSLLWLSQGRQSLQWLAGLGIAVVLLGVTQRFRHYLAMPGVLLAATLGFYGVVWITPAPLAQVRAEGWLLGPFPQGNLWRPLTWEGLQQVDWGVIFQCGDALGLLVFVSVLSLVLTNGSIELALEKDLDLNRELKAVGLANLLAGFGSTMAGNQALPSTLLVHRLGAGSRWTGVFKTLPCFTVLILGPTFLNYFPKPILGSLLLYLGIHLLWQWLYRAWFQLAPLDYGIILVTLAMINQAGFIAGIGVGVGLAIVQFLYQCGRIETVGAAEDPPAAGSSVTLASLQSQYGAVVDQVSLRGFLFFGTAKSLRRQLCDRISSPAATITDAPRLRYLLLDCQQVTGLDATAAMSLNRLLKLAYQHDCTLVFCQLAPHLEQRLLQSQEETSQSPVCVRFARREEALQFCQAQLKPEVVPHPPVQGGIAVQGPTPSPQTAQVGCQSLQV